MSRGLFFGPNAGIRRTLKEPDHLVHISVQEIEFLTQIGFHSAHLPSHTNSVFNAHTRKRASLWRRLRNRLRGESSRKHRAPGKLRREWEMDNFAYSHRCTSYVRLWLGARSVCQHQRVPLSVTSFSPSYLSFCRYPYPNTQTSCIP
jgi:hypothetical protein